MMTDISRTESVKPTFFETIYNPREEPWKFSSGNSEEHRHDQVYRALEHHHYTHAFEPGCSFGGLTQKLSTICDRIDALDISPDAVAIASARCAYLPHVSVRCASLSRALPERDVDLLVLSEIGYYFNAFEWGKRIRTLLNYCATPTTILAYHWLGFSEDYIMRGDEVHEIIESIDGLVLEYHDRNNGYRLDRWTYS